MANYTKGREKHGGRKKGVPNKINRELRGLILLEEGHDPIKAMINIARNPKASLELRGKMNAELAGYIYVKKRAIEHSGTGGGPLEIRVIRVGREKPVIT